MFQNITPITKNIIILNVIIFILAMLIPQSYQYLAAFFPTSPYFKSWQIITHMFMHGGFMHIAFNMLTFASFGPVLERFLGEKKFVILYFLSGLGAFALFNLWEYYQLYQDAQPLIVEGLQFSDILKGDFEKFPVRLEGNAQNIVNILSTPMVGASGAIFGVVAAFSTLFPDAKLSFMFIPYPIKAKYLFPIIVAVSIYLGFSGNMSGVAHFAHVGGAIVGFLLAKYWNKNKFRIR